TGVINESIEKFGGDIAKRGDMIAQNSAVIDYFTSDDLQSRMASIKSIRLLMTYMLNDQSEIADVAVIDRNDTILYHTNQVDSVLWLYLTSVHREDFFGEAAQARFITLNDGERFAYLSPVYDPKSPTARKRVATCVILCRSSAVTRFLDQALDMYIRGARLYDGSGEMIYMAGGGETDDAASGGKQWSGSGETTTGNGETATGSGGAAGRVLTYAVNPFGWRIEYDIADAIDPRLDFLSPAILFQAAVSLMMLVITAGILQRSLFRPLGMLIRKLSPPPRSYELTLRFGNELDTIVRTIYELLRQLEADTEIKVANERKILELQLLVQQAEFSALQSQINPHFLYNTLECIRSISLFYNVNEVAQIASSMAEMFRYSIKGAPYVQLWQELDIVEHYMRILKIRFGDRFLLIVEIPEIYRELTLPRMVLQPLIENAIYHGLEPVERDGLFIRIEAAMSECGDALLLSVEDNGLGFDDAALLEVRALLERSDLVLNADKAHRAVGLCNINQRVKYMIGQGGGFGLTIASTPNTRTVVTLRLPIVEQPDRG
ncbi:MAG: sensor histidine kinase, partial [Clostridiales bacterium]|nr:sensor histidine kinase [Clostridiales bacterium]